MSVSTSAQLLCKELEIYNHKSLASANTFTHTKSSFCRNETHLMPALLHRVYHTRSLVLMKSTIQISFGSALRGILTGYMAYRTGDAFQLNTPGTSLAIGVR